MLEDLILVLHVESQVLLPFWGINNPNVSWVFFPARGTAEDLRRALKPNPFSPVATTPWEPITLGDGNRYGKPRPEMEAKSMWKPITTTQ